jgi:hypothetical protein
MRPGAFRLPFAAACLIAASVFSPDVSAAPRAGFFAGARPLGFGHHSMLGLGARPAFGLRALGRRTGLGGSAPALFGRYDAFGRDRAGSGRYGRGFGFGGGFLGAGYFGGCCGAEGGVAAIEERIKPEWPTSIGIPPSPVLPPAIYVIGGERRKASATRRTTRRPGAAKGAFSPGASAPRLASGARFIPVPNGR